MMNDLLKLKEELEMARKYVPLVGFKEEDIAISSKLEAKTILEYAAMENTDEFVVLCENLIKEAMVLFGKIIFLMIFNTFDSSRFFMYSRVD